MTTRPMIRNAADRERVRKWLERNHRAYKCGGGGKWALMWIIGRNPYALCGPAPKPKKKARKK